MDKNLKIAENVLAAVGGKDNVTFVTHCMTRLRFNVKDESVLNDEEIKKIGGVLGTARSGGQFQIIIGPNVSKVYAHLCELGDFKMENAIDENVDTDGKKTVKGVLSSILDTLSGSITPLIPAMMAASMFKMLVAVFGPGMLNVMSAESDLYILFTFVGDAGFYFFPIFIGYTAAKKMNANPMIGMLLGAILVHPTFVSMVGAEEGFSVYGIPCTVQNYSMTVLPIIFSVYVLSLIEKVLNKIIPDLLRTVFIPFISVLIMLPLMLCVLGPIGGFIGNYLSQFLLGLGDIPVVGILAVALIAGLWEFLVMSGMHQVFIASMFIVFTQSGIEGVVCPAATCASFAVHGMLLGSLLKIKDKEEKSLTMGYFVAGMIGGITEPGLFGNALKFKRPFIGLFTGGFAGGLYAALTGTVCYTLVPVANFVAISGYAGGPQSNLINGVIASVVAFVVAAVVTYFTGYKKDDPVVQ